MSDLFETSMQRDQDQSEVQITQRSMEIISHLHLFDQEEIEQFSKDLARLKMYFVDSSLAARRADKVKEDAFEELAEVHQDVEEIETQLSQSVNIGMHLIEKNQ